LRRLKTVVWGMNRLALFSFAGMIALMVANTIVVSILLACVQIAAFADQGRFLQLNMETILISMVFLFLATLVPASILIALSWTYIWEDARNYIYFGVMTAVIVATIFIFAIPEEIDSVPEQISLFERFSNPMILVLILLLSGMGGLWAFVFWLVLKRFLPWMYE
jgi:hypothetical protein